MPTHNPPDAGPARSVEQMRGELGFTVDEMARALGLSRQRYSAAINRGGVSRILELAAEGLLHRRQRSREFVFLVRVRDRVAAVTLVRRPRALNGAEVPVPDMTFLVNLRDGNPTVRPLGQLASIVLEQKEYMLLPTQSLEISGQDPRRPASPGNGIAPSDLDRPTRAKSFLIINDVIGVLTEGAQLRVSQILDRLEQAGITWFDMTLRRARRVEQLRTILYAESRRETARVERTGNGFYRSRQPEIPAEASKGEAVC